MSLVVVQGPTGKVRMHFAESVEYVNCALDAAWTAIVEGRTDQAKAVLTQLGLKDVPASNAIQPCRTVSWWLQVIGQCDKPIKVVG